MNWVEKRAAAEELLNLHAEEQWQNLRAALQDCCETYSKKYCQQENSTLSSLPENGHRLRVTRTLKADQTRRFKTETNTLLISFDANTYSVSVTSDEKPDTVFIKIVSNDQSVWLTDKKDKAIDHDEGCQLILEPFFFGQSTPREKVEERPLRAATGSMGWVR
jgi:nucleoid-associated protein YejK